MRKNRRSFGLVLIVLLLALSTLAGCAQPMTDLRLASSPQRLPMPKFVARDQNARGGLPTFSQIRVYELNDDCILDTCPVVWDVTVAEDHSPNEFVYGGFPGFGSQTIVSAKELRKNQRYLLVTVPTTAKTGRGEFRFRISPQGDVIPD